MKTNKQQKFALTILTSILMLSSFSTFAQKYDLIAHIETTDPSCFGENDGSILVTASGGTEPYTYLWSIGDTTATIQNLTIGLYNVIITDSDGATISSDIELSQPDPVVISSIITDISSPNSTDGSIDVTFTGGDGNYIFIWQTSNGNGLVPNQMDQTNLSDGNYNINVMDGKGCRASKDFELGAIILVNPVTEGFSGPINSGVIPTGLVYPNPSHGIVTLTSLKKMDRIEVYSSMGILVNEVKNLDESINDEQISLLPGNYNVVFIHLDGTKNTEKLIVR